MIAPMRVISKATLVVALLAIIIPGASPADERADRRERALSLLKTSHQQFADGHYDSALTTLEALRQEAPRDQDALYYLAVTHLALGDTGQAVATLNDGIAQAPLSSRIKLLRVRLHLARKEIEPARHLLDTVFAFKPNDPEAMYLDGALSLAEGDSAQTLELWERALERVGQKQRRRSTR